MQNLLEVKKEKKYKKKKKNKHKIIEFKFVPWLRLNSGFFFLIPFFTIPIVLSEITTTESIKPPNIIPACFLCCEGKLG